MQHFISSLLISMALLTGLSCSQLAQKSSERLSKELESGFKSPPDSILTSVYWYWISDNISKEGVVKDLQAMKQAGINRAFIGNIGIADLPYGPVKMLSDEWWDILHTALKTATDLGIEIGIFNSPGWSQSGGPWIKPEESMRYLASSSVTLKGPAKVETKLTKPHEQFQDVKVIAFPSNADNEMILNQNNASIESAPRLSDLALLTDRDDATGVSFPKGNRLEINFHTQQPFTMRSLTIKTTKQPQSAHVVLEAHTSEGTWNKLAEFDMNRSNPALNVGFDPFAPIVISVPATTGNLFKLTFTNVPEGAGIAEIGLSNIPRMERYSEKTLAKMHPTPLPYWDAYLWPEQPEADASELTVPKDKVIDISDYLSTDGTLTWEVPEGKWTVLRMGMTPTGVTNSPASPEATGLEVDKMSKKWVAEHFERFIGEILRRIPEADRKCFKVVVQDSYETGGQNFTDDFLQQFEERYGYDPVPYLPVYDGYVVGTQMESDRFLWDLRRLIADKVAYDYVGGLRDICHQHGLITWLENYGHWGFPSEFLMYGGQSDEIGGEFWSEGSLGDIENRAATSAGHIYGKTKISAESNTSGGPAYSRYPAMMKQRTDRFFAEGINNTLLHVYISQPYEDRNPGVNAWFGNEFDRKNTWFSQLDLFTQYLKRSNFMLQQGLNVADVAYFIGEDAPKMTGITDPALPVGYQFDYMNAEVILRDMKVKDGLLTLPHGTQYRILVLPKLETMRPEVLKKIMELVHDGGIVIGPQPNHSPSLQNQPMADEEIKQLSTELWGDVDGMKVKHRKFGKGTIMNGLSLEEAFVLLENLPDCKLPEDRSIHYGHRTLKGIDIYFLSNQTNETKEIFPEFRVTGRQPELWDAVSGSIRDLPAFLQKEKSTTVPIKLAPYESAYIVFRKASDKGILADNLLQSSKSHLNDTENTALSSSQLTKMLSLNYPETEIVASLEGPWQVAFDPARRGPAQPVQFDRLIDWTTSSDPEIKYYSGQATYSINFTFPEKKENEKIILDLRNLTAMGKVYLNGKYCGGVWAPPYELDITPEIAEGKNELKIEVVNNWMNRLIGDQNLPESKRETWCFVNPYKADSKLQPSGLFGPVSIGIISQNNK